MSENYVGIKWFVFNPKLYISTYRGPPTALFVVRTLIQTKFHSMGTTNDNNKI